MLKENTNGNSASVVMHEIMHAITLDRIMSDQKLRAEFEEIARQYLVAFPQGSNTLSEHFLEEFIADVWSNKEVIARLKQVKYEGEQDKSLWDKIVEFFKGKLFSDADDSLFQKASTSIVKLLQETPTVEAKGRYFENEQEAEYAKESQALTKQIDNLLDSNIISATEVDTLQNKQYIGLVTILLSCKRTLA